MNSITVAGNISKDIKIRAAGSDQVGSFAVADNQGKDKPAIFFNCQLWGKRAISLEQYLIKGQAVTVSGTLSESGWTDKDGNARKSLEIRVNDVALQGGKKEVIEYPEPRQAPKKQHDFSDIDDDIPF